MRNTMEPYFIRRNLPEPFDYEKSYWGVVTDPDGNVRDRLAEREKYIEDIKEEMDFLNNLPVGCILDVGCGLGFLLSGLKDGWEKHGVEVSKFAASHATQFGQIHLGDLHSALYPDEYFDVVVMHHVIEHIEDPVATINEIRRILKRGGHLLLGTPDFDSGCARRFGENYRLLHDKTHISLFTNDSMHRFLRDHGFQIDRVEYPFFETRYFTKENLERLFDTSEISPPFYGNFMTFYCVRPGCGVAYERLHELSCLVNELAERMDKQVTQVASLIIDSFESGGKVFACGNGGSAADAQHFVGEMIGRFLLDRPSLPAITLSTDTSVLTAVGNDYGFETVFSRQIEGLGKSGDVLIALSTSGKSPNVLRALKTAQEKQMKTIALVGPEKNSVLEACDLCICIPSQITPRIQEMHTALLHAICEIVEKEMFSERAD